jgi:hypothetical protein
VNKIEKSFVDYFLLNNTAELELSRSPERFSKLNVLEQILMVIYLKGKLKILKLRN